MPKLVNSVAYELGLAKDKIESLENRNRELEAEVIRLTKYIQKKKLPLPKLETPPATSTPSISKGFMGPTKAFLNRTNKTSEEEVVTIPEAASLHNPRWSFSKYQYKDGNLVEHIYCYRYQNPTTSSVMKSLPSRRLQAYLDTPFAEEKSYTRVESPAPGDEGSYEGRDEDEEQSGNSNAARDLSKRSRLDDGVPDHLESVPLRSTIVYNSLRRALRLAQEIAFDCAKKHFPKLARTFEGPQEVLLGRLELESSFFFHWPYSGLHIAGQQITRGELMNVFDTITRLRNCVCHYSNYTAQISLHHHDFYTKAVQTLAVMLGDERRAFRARALRDELVKQSEKSLKEMEQLLALAELPGARPWEHHQMRTFKMLTELTESSSYDAIAPSVLRAAYHWSCTQPNPKTDWLPQSLADQWE